MKTSKNANRMFLNAGVMVENGDGVGVDRKIV